mmetsp:Transcript_48032/g.79561  ORF Transcript_48032/g.79561 Transcript_48032/m.79561 type:complete len:449 (+) Transcript_48032:1297-2643(+)
MKNYTLQQLENSSKEEGFRIGIFAIGYQKNIPISVILFPVLYTWHLPFSSPSCLPQVLSNTVDVVLDYTVKNTRNKENTSSQPKHQVVIIDRMLRSISSLQGSLASRREVILETKIDPTLHFGITIEEMKITQVLNNLVSNAIKFTPASKRVIFSAKRISSERKLSKPNSVLVPGLCTLPSGRKDMAHHYMLLQVKDEGCGFDIEKMEKIFQPFQQENDSTARTHGGTGLGLAIVKSIVAEMDGWVHVDSSPQGSTFGIVLPYTSDEQSQPEKEKTQRNGEEKVSKNIHVFVLDDDFLSQMLCKRYCEEKIGVNCTICSNGNVLLKAVRNLLSSKQKQLLPVVITETHMSEMSGVDILKSIRSLEGEILAKRECRQKIINDKVDDSSDGKGREDGEIPLTIPVIAVTALPDEFRVNPGFDHIMKKPLEYSELMRTICKFSVTGERLHQ